MPCVFLFFLENAGNGAVMKRIGKKCSSLPPKNFS